jgi:hypothetical protein
MLASRLAPRGSCFKCGVAIKKKRKYCNDCLKTPYKIKESTKSLTDQGLKYCPKCNTNHPLDDFWIANIKRNKEGLYRSSYCKNCQSKLSKQRYRDIKQKWIDYKGGKCTICGYNSCQAALEFHHLDPKLKDFNVSRFHSIKKTDEDKILQELDKCILLCSNCHRELHFNIGLDD